MSNLSTKSDNEEEDNEDLPKEEEEEEDLPDVSFGRVLALNKPEIPFILRKFWICDYCM